MIWPRRLVLSSRRQWRSADLASLKTIDQRPIPRSDRRSRQGERRLSRQAALRLVGPQPHRRERALDRVRHAHVLPVLGGEVVEHEQGREPLPAKWALDPEVWLRPSLDLPPPLGPAVRQLSGLGELGGQTPVGSSCPGPTAAGPCCWYTSVPRSSHGHRPAIGTRTRSGIPPGGRCRREARRVGPRSAANASLNWPVEMPLR